MVRDGDDLAAPGADQRRLGQVVGGVLVLVVVPEIWAQHLGTANPTVLPGDYAGRLLVVLAVVAGLTLVAVAVATARARRPRRT